MKEIFDKLSSYNIFNYLLPGIIFVWIAKYLTKYDFIQENNFIGAFAYYFIGMTISRFGSHFIEPALKKVSFLKFSDYKEFVHASKAEQKIELLSEVNNSYRTITSMFCLLLLLKVYNYIQNNFSISDNISIIILIVAVGGLFLFSYRKQTNYVTKRIKANTP